MARFLIFDRNLSRIQEINSTTGVLAPVGPAIAGLEASSLWDYRCTNVVALFRGDVYVLARTNANEYVVYQWDGAAMNLVHGPILLAGVTSPVGLAVINDHLVGVVNELAIGQNTHYLFSTDGVVWGTVTTGGLTNAAASMGTTAVWRKTLFQATGNGIQAYGIDSAVTAGLPAPLLTFDIGDDGDLVTGPVFAGSFAYWDNDLYFLRPDVGAGALLYKLDPTWDADTPIASPAWTNQLATGLPSAGALTDAVDRGTYCLFRSREDELIAVYSGTLGTVIAQTTAATFPVFTDITANVMPANVAALVNAGVSLLEDDRRRTNQLHTFFIRDTTLGNTHVLSWNGLASSPMVPVSDFVAQDFMPPNDQKADYRTYTAREPAVEFDQTAPPTQPFPGRVVLTYIVKDSLSRIIDISPEYSIDGDEWSVMSEGTGNGTEGTTSLLSSPAGEQHVFVWDAFNDLPGDISNMQMRIVPRIVGV